MQTTRPRKVLDDTFRLTETVHVAHLLISLKFFVSSDVVHGDCLHRPAGTLRARCWTRSLLLKNTGSLTDWFPSTSLAATSLVQHNDSFPGWIGSHRVHVTRYWLLLPGSMALGRISLEFKSDPELPFVSVTLPAGDVLRSCKAPIPTCTLIMVQ